MKKFFTLANLVFIFIIINFLVSGLYGYFTREFEIDSYDRVRASQPAVIEKKKYHNQSYYTSVVRRDLFATAKPDSQKTTPLKKSETTPDKEIKLTELKLELNGTITGTGSKPVAIIRKPGNKNQVMYTEGDTVDRARIKSILRQRVILLVDGREETLLMEKIKNRTKPGTKGYEETTDFSTNNARLTVEEIVLARNDVETFTGDLATLRKQVRIRPHFYRGKMDGFRLTGLKKASVFYTKLGLRNGDVISAVNDQEIKSVGDVNRFYEGFIQLDGNGVTTVDIKRNGLPETIRYSIE